jgi:hypothetical protein
MNQSIETRTLSHILYLGTCYVASGDIPYATQLFPCLVRKASRKIER